MKIVVLVYGPDFACSENLTQAFKLWGNTQLISITPSDWRQYDPGILATTPDELNRAKMVMAEADLIVLGDATAVHTLATVSPHKDWIGWATGKQIMAYFGDSAYFKHSHFYDGLIMELRARLFLLPNLIPVAGIEAIPLHHPMPVKNAPKEKRLTIMHAPGRDGKAAQKGTETIEIEIERLKESFDFDYERITGLTIADCLKKKSTAHIVIDQLPPKKAVHGLGRTGTEALSTGSMVLSRMYDTSVLSGYFEPPPAIDIATGNELYSKLGAFLQNPVEIKRQCVKSLDWAKDNISFEKWLAYIGKFL